MPRLSLDTFQQCIHWGSSRKLPYQLLWQPELLLLLLRVLKPRAGSSLKLLCFSARVFFSLKESEGSNYGIIILTHWRKKKFQTIVFYFFFCTAGGAVSYLTPNMTAGSRNSCMCSVSVETVFFFSACRWLQKALLLVSQYLQYLKILLFLILASFPRDKRHSAIALLLSQSSTSNFWAG